MARAYDERLKGIRGLRLPITRDYAKNVFWMYAVLVEDDFGMTRDALRSALKERGIDTRDFFTSCSAQEVIRTLCPSKGLFPVTEDVAARGFYLPSGLTLTEEQVDAVCSALRSIAHAA
jgi:perosamine synthetase